MKEEKVPSDGNLKKLKLILVYLLFVFEKAMDIIREGMGTHFDPKIAQVFLDNPDRVREIALENQRTIG